ncbi:MAG TPA: hypothetical protein VKR62_18535, partial [Roseiarcus sp.]|nr:hypothetical protein [Roseiarcus sp.]
MIIRTDDRREGGAPRRQSAAVAILGWPGAAASGRRALPGRSVGETGFPQMQVEETAIPAVKIIIAKKHGDARGFFSE